MARLASGVAVGALLRAASSRGGFATVLARGHAEAGAIHVVVREGGRSTLLSPVPSLTGDGRAFEPMAEGMTDADVQAAVDRARAADADAWVVEVENLPVATVLDLI